MNDNTNISEQITNQKAAIYIRVSTTYQIDKDSLAVQKRELISYSQMVLNISEYEIFEDPGYSAKNTERPDYKRMMDRLRTGEFSHLLVWKIDRISRNLLDFAGMYKELKSLGVTFVSKNEQFDTSSAIGEAMLKIILVFAELERNMTSERVAAVMLSRAQNGQWNGGRVPFGYNWSKDAKEFSIVDDEAKVVKMMYEMYEEHQSLLYVARTINELGYRTKRGFEWSSTTVHNTLTNMFYIGSYRYNALKEGNRQKKRDSSEWIITKNHHPAIIPEPLFDRVNFILTRNIRGGYKRNETHKRKNIHLFAGLLKCGKCGYNMPATLDKRRANGVRPSVYGCSRRRKRKMECDNKYVSDLMFGPFVFNLIANIIKASKSISNSTSITVLERKLLRGPVFSNVESIDIDGLQSLRDILLSGKTGFNYNPAIVFNSLESSDSELCSVEDRKRKFENALNRLRSLYLYGDKDIAEKDYIVEKDKILTIINSCEKRISEIKKENSNSPNVSDNFSEKASYFIMAEKLTEKNYFDYEKYIANIDLNIPRHFLQTIIEKIEITDTKVTSIKFKNGLLVTFNYKEDENQREKPC